MILKTICIFIIILAGFVAFGMLVAHYAIESYKKDMAQQKAQKPIDFIWYDEAGKSKVLDMRLEKVGKELSQHTGGKNKCG